MSKWVKKSCCEEELEKLADGYTKGEILSSELKNRCISVVQDFVKKFQENKDKVTDEVYKKFISVDKYTNDELSKEKLHKGMCSKN